MFDTAGRKTSSTFFSDERYWGLICVKAQKVTSHKYVVLNGNIMSFLRLWEIQNSVKGFFGNCSFKFESLESSANSS